MKLFNNYINDKEIYRLNESVISKLLSWFKNVYKTQEKLLQNNKPISLKIDTKKIKGTEQPCNLEDILKNKEEMNIINNVQIGFPTTAELLKNQKKYFTGINNEEFSPQIYRYFYVDGNNTYSLAYLMYDEKIKYIDGYVNLLDIDVLQSIENLSEVQKFIINSFEDKLKQNQKNGIVYDIKHPRIKGTLIKLGFNTSKENKNWLIKIVK